jgi:hypothetical protein
VFISVIYPLSGWNVRVEVFIAVAFVAISCILALVIKGRLFGKLHWTDTFIPLAYFTLLQYEIFIGTPNLAHGPIPIFLITLTAFILTVNNQKIRAISLVVLAFFSTYTGFAIFSGILIVAILILFSLRSPTLTLKLWNVGALIFSIAIFGSFFINYFHAPAVDCFQFPHHKPLQYLEFSFLQFGAAFGWPSTMLNFERSYYLVLLFSAMLFSILLALFGYYSIRAIRFMDKKSLLIFYLASFTLLFIAFTSIGRVCLGIHAAFSSRYVTYAIPGIIAIYFGIISFEKPLKLKYLFLSGILVLLFVKEISVYYRNGISWYSDGKKNWVHCYRENHSIEDCNRKANFKVYPDETRIVEKLNYLETNNLNFFKDND